jgi:hypothetical protein
MTTFTILGLAALFAGPAHAHSDARVDPEDPRIEHWFIETGFGGGGYTDSGYTSRLEDFGFERPWILFGPEVFMLHGSVVHTPVPNLGVVFTAGNLDSESWSRDMSRADAPYSYSERYDWSTWRGGVYARGSVPVLNGWLTPYLQAGGGPALAVSSYSDNSEEELRYDLGWHIAAAGGLQAMLAIPDHRHFGLYWQVETSYAPVLENLTGDVHNSGGKAFLFGVRLGY